MGSFKSTIITKKGHNLMAKLTARTAEMNFTKMRSSEHDYSELTSAELESLAEIQDIKQSITVSEVKRINDASVKVSGAITNTSLTEGYYLKTIALYANDPDEGEILYSVTPSTLFDWMPPNNGVTSSSVLIDLITVVSNAENVTIDVDPNAVATITQLKDLDEKFISQMSETTQKAFSPTDLFIQQWARKMFDGVATEIWTKGDSTYYGALNASDPSLNATRPAPEIMEDILRTFFYNGNIKVVNKGVDGYATWNVIDTWEAEISNATANIIYINYGINNRWQDAKVLKSDLIKMIQICRKYGKEVVLETPNIVLKSNPNVDSSNNPPVDSGGNLIGGNVIHSYYTLEHAQVTRDVARDVGVFLVDNYKITQQYNYINTDVTQNLADGMHPSQELYFIKAINMCAPFLAPFCGRVKVGDIISVADSCCMIDGSKAPTFENASKVKFIGNGKIICFAFYLEEKLDVSLGLTQKKDISKLTINLDGKFISSFSTTNQDATNYFVDNEFIIIKGLSKGLHMITFNNEVENSTDLLSINFVKFYKSVNSLSGIKKQETSTIVCSSSSNELTDIITDNYTSDLDITFTTAIPDKKGVSIFTNKTNQGNTYGITLYINDGFLAISEASPNGYVNLATIEADTNYKNTSHQYRFKLAQNSTQLELYIDGTLKQTISLQQKYLGGFAGIWNLAAGDITVKIDKIIR